MIDLATARRSLGIHKHCEEMVDALAAVGVDARLTEHPTRSRPTHFHLGNSTRRLLPRVLAARRPSLLTLHDVVPRHRALRRAWPALARVVLRGHRYVVHSSHARLLLSEIGIRGPVEVVRLAVTDRRLPEDEVAATRTDLAPDGRPILVSAGVLKTAKGVLEVLAAAPRFPDLVFAFAGEPGDAATEAALRVAPSNVVHRHDLDDEAFDRILAAADVLLAYRQDWVGEASAPVVRAHALGTPVSGYAGGGLPEYCGAEDHLVDGSVPVVQALRDVQHRLESGWPRLPLGAPQVTTWAESAARHASLYADMGWH